MCLNAIVFDFDGVLAKTMPFHVQSEKILFKNHGVGVSVEELMEFSGMRVSEFVKAVVEKKGLSENWQELVEEKYKIMSELIEERGVERMPGAAEFVKNAAQKNLRLAVASGSRKEFIQFVLSKVGIDNVFEVVLGDNEIEKGKPAPDIFLKCAKLLEVKPSECLVIEDSENGIIAAKRAGMKAIALRGHAHQFHDFSKADLVVGSFKGIDLEKLRGLFE